MSRLKIQLQEFRRRVVAGSFPQYSDLAASLCGLRFVQADPIRSPARAQDLILRRWVDPCVSGDLEQLWEWSYRFEAYISASKRARGYYAMPLLWQENVIAWANAKVIENPRRLAEL